MQKLQRVAGLVCVVLVAGLTMTGEARGKVSCHRINARGAGEDLGGGATRARIIGGGLLHGFTNAQFEFTGMSGTRVVFEGPVTFTTARGTLTITVEGTFDPATGEFSASGPVTDASGKLEDATGTIYIDGVQDFSTGTFVEDVTGEICVDLAPLHLGGMRGCRRENCRPPGRAR